MLFFQEWTTYLFYLWLRYVCVRLMVEQVEAGSIFLLGMLAQSAPGDD